MSSPAPTIAPFSSVLEQDNALDDYKAKFSPSNLTTTYSAVYGGFLLSLFIYVYYLKRKYGIHENIFLMLWSMEEIIQVGIQHILDTASDVGVLLQFYEGMVDEYFIDGESSSEKVNQDKGISMTLFFVASMIAFWGYRIKSGFEVWRVTNSKTRGVLQALFDWELFRILWINLNLGEVECIGLVKWFRGEEAIFESAFQSVLQLVYLLSNESISSPVIYFSFVLSLESLTSYFFDIDEINLVDEVSYGISLEEMLCQGEYCCKISRKRNKSLADHMKNSEEKKENEQTTEIEMHTGGYTKETDKKEEAEEEEKRPKGDWCCGYIHSPWIIERAFRQLDVVSKVFMYALVWLAFGLYWFLVLVGAELFVLYLIIKDQKNAWRWEYLWVLFGASVIPERSRPEDSKLTLRFCRLNMLNTSFWICQYVERAVIMVLVTVWLFIPVTCGASEIYGCVGYDLKKHRVTRVTGFGFITLIIAWACVIVCPLLYYYKIRTYILPTKQAIKGTLSNSLTEAIFHRDNVGVQAMLQYGVDPNGFDEIGSTPLYRACSDGNIEVAKLLLEDKRTNPNLGANNIYGSAALHGSCVRGHETTLKLLLAHPNIDINYIDKRGATPLDAAVYYNHYYGKDHTNIIRLLKERNAKFNIFSEEPNFEPSLQVFEKFWLGGMGMITTEACNQGYVRLITELFEKKANYKIDPAARNRFIKQMSAIEIAANKGYTEIVKILLENGYDPTEKKNEMKKSALELAQEGGFEECARVIQEWIDKHPKK